MQVSAINHNNNRFGRFFLPVRTLAISFLCLLIFVRGQGAETLFIYDRAAVEAGEWWRILTGQFIHIGIDHLFWDLTAFIMLAAMIEWRGRRAFWSLMALSFLLVGLFVHYCLPELAYYSGLSGGLNALFFVTTWDMWKRDGGWLAPVLIFGSALKIFFEVILQDAIFTNTAWPPVPEVHAIGYICGILWIGLRRICTTGHADQAAHQGSDRVLALANAEKPGTENQVSRNGWGRSYDGRRAIMEVCNRTLCWTGYIPESSRPPARHGTISPQNRAE